MDRDALLEELEENIDCVKRAGYKLDDLNMDLPLSEWEFLKMHLANVRESFNAMQIIYEKNIEKLGGNY